MRLYSCPSTHFLEDTAHNQIAEKLKQSFFQHFRFKPAPSEVNSWRNSLRAIASVFERADLTDHGVMLEYQLPLTSKRLDCLICGRDATKTDQAVIIELKQWDRCEPSEGENLVCTWVGNGLRDVLHPSAQVGQYQRYLQDTHTAFYDGPAPVGVSSCSYLHNYTAEPGDYLFDESFTALIAEFPTYTADDVPELTQHLLDHLSGGDGTHVLQRIEESSYRPSKKLMEHVANVIKGKPEYVLLDEQMVVYEKVLATARRGFHDRRKTVLIVKGGPGTGKSVIAINLMSDLLLQQYNAQYATGSKAFTQTLKKIIGSRGAIQFKYFNSYIDAEANMIDVLICDEAHRIRENSFNRYRAKASRTGKQQIEELIDVSKVGVYFIDDDQVVRPNEVGSSHLIREYAKSRGCVVYEYELEAQFRCAGSEGFVNWINNTLDIQRTANVLWETDENFDFRIYTSPEALEAAVRARASEGHTARMTAGFCWPWSKQVGDDGELVPDVQIGSYKRPWNAHHEARHLPKHIPKAEVWAYEPGGIDQIGCVYTAQGFEFDYVGVIFGTDLKYDFDRQSWAGHPENSHDRAVKAGKSRYIDLVKNTYRVLLSRGLKGCYVYFMDKQTERFFKSRIEGSVGTTEVELATARQVPKVRARESLPPSLTRISGNDLKPFQNAVPLYDLKVAAGRFTDEQSAGPSSQQDELLNPHEYTWVRLPDAFRPAPGLFVCQVIGESMNRRIPSGSYCLFRLISAGTRNGKVVLAQHREIQDSDTGGHYTVKVYESEKRELDDGTWEHTRILLKPDSTMEEFHPIEIDAVEAQGLRVIAELVAILT